MNDLSELQSPYESIFRPHLDEMPPVFRAQFLHAPEDPDLILEGEMSEVWHRPRWLSPLFWLMGKFGIFIPYRGENVPARVRLRTGRDEHGQPFQSFQRRLAFPKPYSFNTVMGYDAQVGKLVEMLGPGKMMVMAWEGAFSPPDVFTFGTYAVALKCGRFKLWLPRWLWALLGTVDFRQQALPDDSVQLDLIVTHPWMGDFFGYRGVFRVVKDQEG